MKADIYIIFICTTLTQTGTEMRQFKVLWNSLGTCVESRFCILFVIREHVMQIISALGEGNEILFITHNLVNLNSSQ